MTAQRKYVLRDNSVHYLYERMEECYKGNSHQNEILKNKN